MLIKRTVTICAVFLVVLLTIGAAWAAPVAQAPPSITPDPASGAPGSQIVVAGKDFAPPTVAPNDVRFFWDTTASPLIGNGSVRLDGTFLVMVTIPPSATPGPHTIIAVSSYQETAETSVTVTGELRQAAYIYDTDATKAAAFETLLEGEGMLPTTLIKLSEVTGADLSAYSLILIGPDTGNLEAWGTPSAVTHIARSGKPILGIGEGGYAFFGKLQLHIGYPHGAHTTADQVGAVDLNHPVYQTPHLFTQTPLTLYGQIGGAVGIHMPRLPSGISALGRDLQSRDSYFVIQQSSRYLLWGFDGGPDQEMTLAGKQFFINVSWFQLLYRPDVDTLILVDYQRMQDIGYNAVDVNALESKINTLVGKPKWQSNMIAVVKRLGMDVPTYVQSKRTAWDGAENSVTSTNDYVAAIDVHIESLKQGVYPNLQYVILVGAHEVIPMFARPADDMDTPYRESQWAGGLPQTSGYFYSLYHDTSGGATYGRYLTDSVYGDLSYVSNGQGVDDVLIPELAVGRLVEAPAQIGVLLDNYMASNGSLSRTNMASIASNDYMDGGQAAANHMGPLADTALIQSTFDTNLVSPKVSIKNDIIYLSGHGAYNSISPGYKAGAHTTQGDTEELTNLPDAVIAASGCHNGVNFGNKLYHDYTGNTTYGEFPERFANKGVGIYLGSTGYTWISGSGSSTNPAHTGWSEKLATHFLKHLLNDGPAITAGQAFKAAVNEYVSDYGGVGNPHRRVLAIATFYGIPNYRWSTGLVIVAQWKPIHYSLIRQWMPRPSDLAGQGVTAAADPVTPTITVTQQITLEILGWSVESDGLIDIPGASYTGDYDEPILPIVSESTVLPDGANVTGIIWNQAESISTTFANDVPLASMAVLTTPVTNTFSYVGFYPPTPYYSTTVSALGGGGVEVGMTIVPVQYDQSTSQTRVWTRMIFEVKYEVDPYALKTDSDVDSLPDYWESGHGLDPEDDSGTEGASGDPDRDGLTNAQEFGQGTDPLDPDTDHDGSLDGFEILDGTDPLDPSSRMGRLYLPVVLKNKSQ